MHVITLFVRFARFCKVFAVFFAMALRWRCEILIVILLWLCTAAVVNVLQMNDRVAPCFSFCLQIQASEFIVRPSVQQGARQAAGSSGGILGVHRGELQTDKR